MDPERAEQRWNRVLDLMVEDGWITAQERAAQVLPETIPVQAAETYAGPQGYLLDLVRRELRDRASFTDEQIDTAGLSVVTTIEKPLQDSAVRAVTSLMDGTLAGEAPAPNLRPSVVSVDPVDGAIVALYGGPDFITQSFNAATQGRAQAGSTFKPFTLVAALENGIPLTTTYPGFSPMEVEGWDSEVDNFGGTDYPTIDLVRATEQSVNTVYAQLNRDVGPEKTADVAQRAGITTPVGHEPGQRARLRHGVPARHGVRVRDPRRAGVPVDAVHRPAGDLHLRRQRRLPGPRCPRAGLLARRRRGRHLRDDAAWSPTARASGGSRRSTGRSPARPARRTDNKSAWFVGFTPRISTAVALYQPTPDGTGEETITPFGRRVTEVTGSTWPAALWADYMREVFAVEKYAPVEEFPERANVGRPTATSTPRPTATPTPTAEPEPTEPAEVTVPGGLAGRTRADAEAALVNAGLTAAVTEQASDSVPAGRVISASPDGGAVPAGTTVTLVVSTGPRARARARADADAHRDDRYRRRGDRGDGADAAGTDAGDAGGGEG